MCWRRIRSEIFSTHTGLPWKDCWFLNLFVWKYLIKSRIYKWFISHLWLRCLALLHGSLLELILRLSCRVTLNLKLDILVEVLTLTLFLEFVVRGAFLATELLKENSSDVFCPNTHRPRPLVESRLASLKASWIRFFWSSLYIYPMVSSLAVVHLVKDN